MKNHPATLCTASMLIIVIVMMLILRHQSNRWIQDNLEALSETETPPQISCLPDEAVCSIIVQAADSVLYTIEIEGMKNVR